MTSSSHVLLLKFCLADALVHCPILYLTFCSFWGFSFYLKKIYILSIIYSLYFNLWCSWRGDASVITYYVLHMLKPATFYLFHFIFFHFSLFSSSLERFGCACFMMLVTDYYFICCEIKDAAIKQKCTCEKADNEFAWAERAVAK